MNDSKNLNVTVNKHSWIFLGFSQVILDTFAFWYRRWSETANLNISDLPPNKVFKPKFNLPRLNDYSSTFPSLFWAQAPSNYVAPAVSLVDPHKLYSLARFCGFFDLGLLEEVCSDLRSGAVIGCKGDFRNPSRAMNAPSAYKNGAQVTDAIWD